MTMANERQSRQQDQQRSGNQPMEQSASDASQRPAGRGGRQDAGTDVQRSQAGEYQRRGTIPSVYSGFDEGPFAMMRRLSDEMDRLFEGFGIGRGFFPSFGRGTTGAQSGGELPSLWTPHVEMCERGNKLVVSVDLPGVKRDDVNVEVEQDAITIQGERRQESTTNERGLYRSERSYGSFYRQIPLPEGANPDSANATFRDGVLEIELDAPQQQSKGRRLEIKEAGSSSGTTGSSTGTTGGSTQASGTTPGTH